VSNSTLQPRTRRVLLVVIDGLGSDALRRAIASGDAPTIASLREAGAHFRDAVSPFPSLTPVCLSTIITGVGPDRHRIPSLSWYHRGQKRFVEYGSSFSATRVEGTKAMIEDVILNLNHVHLAESAPTLFERAQDAGLEAASINFLIWRGRTRHTMKHAYGPIARLAKRTKVHAVYGPDHLYFGELYGMTRPLMPQAGIKRPRDWSAGHIARWLLRNTNTQFLLLYLGQHDVASHKRGPDSTQRAIRIADRALGRVIDGLGGIERFRDEFALLVCADHGQTAIEQHAQLEDVFDDVRLFRGRKATDADECDLAVSCSCRSALLYRLGSNPPTSDWIAGRALEAPSVDVVAYAEEGRLVARRRDKTLHIVRNGEGALPTARAAQTGDDHDRWRLDGDLDVLDITIEDGQIRYGSYPDALLRLDQAVRCINAGDVVVSATPGYEFIDIGGGKHSGGSHGSLHSIDSLAPLITLGFEEDERFALPTVRLADIAPAIDEHFALGTGPA
jgi:hypothetical protein